MAMVRMLTGSKKHSTESLITFAIPMPIENKHFNTSLGDDTGQDFCTGDAKLCFL
jgi:hypothetical protein